MNKSILLISTLGDILLLSLNKTAWMFDEMSTNQINVTSKQFTFHVSIKESNTTPIICDDTNYFVFHGVILSPFISVLCAFKMKKGRERDKIDRNTNITKWWRWNRLNIQCDSTFSVLFRSNRRCCMIVQHPEYFHCECKPE